MLIALKDFLLLVLHYFNIILVVGGRVLNDGRSCQFLCFDFALT